MDSTTLANLDIFDNSEGKINVNGEKTELKTASGL